MQTNLESERDEQRRWKLRPRFSDLNIFDQLVANEFLTNDERKQRQGKALSDILRFSANQVPYYRKLFARLNLNQGAVPQPNELLYIPPLAKETIQKHGAELAAERLPPGGKHGIATTTSGTTGNSMRVMHSQRSNQMFNILAQRSRRWYRFDPAGTFAAIRDRPNLPLRPDGTSLPDGETLQLSEWPGISYYFETGKFLGFSNSNPMEQIADWIEYNRPDYLQTYASLLEHLALEFQKRPALRCVRTFNVIGEPLTAGRRARVERIFGAPIKLGYGLNEIGIIAACCPEAGRYHVHDEHCLVEIVDEDGKPCAPGEYGRVLITTLTNYAMPLIRYDTGDIAQALDGPCHCGRTLPNFGPILGRRSRITPVPTEIMALADTILVAMEQLAIELSGNIRMYQLYYFRDDNFELRIVVADTLPLEFSEHINEIWRNAVASRPNKLRIVTVKNVRPPASDKFFHFDSDLFSKPSA